MTNRLLESAFANLSTALIADACVRLQVPLRKVHMEGRAAAGRENPGWKEAF